LALGTSAAPAGSGQPATSPTWLGGTAGPLLGCGLRTVPAAIRWIGAGAGRRSPKANESADAVCGDSPLRTRSAVTAVWTGEGPGPMARLGRARGAGSPRGHCTTLRRRRTTACYRRVAAGVCRWDPLGLSPAKGGEWWWLRSCSWRPLRPWSSGLRAWWPGTYLGRRALAGPAQCPVDAGVELHGTVSRFTASGTVDWSEEGKNHDLTGHR